MGLQDYAGNLELDPRETAALEDRINTLETLKRKYGNTLAEVLEFLNRQVISRKVKQAVNQHRAMSGRKNKAVTIRPLRVFRVVLEILGPEYGGDIGHAHRHAGVAGIGLLDGIHAEGTDGIGEFAA